MPRTDTLTISPSPSTVDGEDQPPCLETTTPPARHWLLAREWERDLARMLLGLIVGFNLYYLYHEVGIRIPKIHDGVLHLLSIERAAAALAAWQDPTDVWLAPIALGFPLFHHYGHLSLVVPAILYRLALGLVPIVEIYNWTNYLLLSFFPLSIYWSMRRFDFPPLTAAFAAVAAPLIATKNLFGFDLASYSWRGWGMTPQLWGMFFLPMAVSQSYATLRDGRGYFAAVLLLAVTMLSHLIVGYIALGSIALFPLLPSSGQDVRRRAVRLAIVAGLFLVVTAYFFVPFFLDSAYMNRGFWEQQWRFNSFGAGWVLGSLASGELFDFGRLPALTIMAGVGLAYSLWRWREERHRIVVALALLWLVMYFGRSTWGALIDLVPGARDLHFHRLIAGVHLAGILLIGIGLAVPWRWVFTRRDPRFLLAALAITVFALYPAFRERAGYLSDNARMMAKAQAALGAEEQDLALLVETLRGLPPGRIYAGREKDWGKEYRIDQVHVSYLLSRHGFDTLNYITLHHFSLNADLMPLFDATRADHYNLFNIRYVVAPAGQRFPEFVQPLRQFGRHRLYEVPTTGYFDLVGADRTFVGDKNELYAAASAWLQSAFPGEDLYPRVVFGGGAIASPRQFPLARAAEVLSQAPPEEPVRGRLGPETVGSGRYEVRVDVDRPDSLLLLKTAYHPNWQATVDGVNVDPVMVMPSYLAIPIGTGAHQVRLEYRPGLLHGGLLVLSLLAIPTIVLAERRRDLLPGLLDRLRQGRWPVVPRPGLRKLGSTRPSPNGRERQSAPARAARPEGKRAPTTAWQPGRKRQRPPS